MRDEFDDDALKFLVESDPRSSVRELSRSLEGPPDQLYKGMKSAHEGTWTKQYGFHTNCPRSRKIFDEQSLHCSLDRVQTDPFLPRIVTGDEKWILCDNNIMHRRAREFLTKNYFCIENIKRLTKKQTKQGESQACSNRVATIARRNEKEIYSGNAIAATPC
ncbi:hypothetical protein K0M31_013423 [Melipona bicolor]|uniref:Uncharacterized protein n=1 Tax=Melipona bicolor TaxID=60889 RepID=A0AA40FHZ8_9HYME|nr:hypothetical protein K0M31_013423 [Melipona bicolor]